MIADVRRLRPLFPKLQMPDGLLNVYSAPPKSPIQQQALQIRRAAESAATLTQKLLAFNHQPTEIHATQRLERRVERRRDLHPLDELLLALKALPAKRRELRDQVKHELVGKVLPTAAAYQVVWNPNAGIVSAIRTAV